MAYLSAKERSASPETSSASVRWSKNQVEQLYKELDKPPREDVLAMIRLYPIWTQGRATSEVLGKLTWVLSENPQHISQVLSKNGEERQLVNIARMYEKMGSEKMRVLWEGASKIETMIRLLQKGSTLPPIITVPGSRYPNSPESSFIDGVHRSLAGMVYFLRTNQEPQMEMLSGEKGSIATRAVGKIFGSRRT